MNNQRWPLSMNTGRRQTPIKEGMSMEPFEALEIKVIAFDTEQVMTESPPVELPPVIRM